MARSISGAVIKLASARFIFSLSLSSSCQASSEEELERPVDLLESLAWLALTKREYLSSQLGLQLAHSFEQLIHYGRGQVADAFRLAKFSAAWQRYLHLN